MNQSLAAFDWEYVIGILLCLFMLSSLVGTLWFVISRERSRLPDGKMHFRFSDNFNLMPPTHSQLVAWRSECAKLTKENENLKKQVRELQESAHRSEL